MLMHGVARMMKAMATRCNVAVVCTNHTVGGPQVRDSDRNSAKRILPGYKHVWVLMRILNVRSHDQHLGRDGAASRRHVSS